MRSPLRTVAASAAFVFLAELVLWPPRAVYWTRLAAVVGDGFTLVFVGLVALSLGVVFAWITGVAVQPFALGAFAAYVVGMIAIEVVLTPNSPVHLVWYAALSTCLVGGVALGSRVGDTRR